MFPPTKGMVYRRRAQNELGVPPIETDKGRGILAIRQLLLKLVREGKGREGKGAVYELNLLPSDPEKQFGKRLYWS